MTNPILPNQEAQATPPIPKVQPENTAVQPVQNPGGILSNQPSVENSSQPQVQAPEKLTVEPSAPPEVAEMPVAPNSTKPDDNIATSAQNVQEVQDVNISKPEVANRTIENDQTNNTDAKILQAAKINGDATDSAEFSNMVKSVNKFQVTE